VQLRIAPRRGVEKRVGKLHATNPALDLASGKSSCSLLAGRKLPVTRNNATPGQSASLSDRARCRTATDRVPDCCLRPSCAENAEDL
jgi:hypothetical protein